MPSLVICYGRDEIARLQYPVLVEMWDRVVGRGACGSKRRKYHAAFTAAERKTISRWHSRFHRWYLVSGPPDRVIFKEERTLRLIKRAIAFFATV